MEERLRTDGENKIQLEVLAIWCKCFKPQEGPGRTERWVGNRSNKISKNKNKISAYDIKNIKTQEKYWIVKHDKIEAKNLEERVISNLEITLTRLILDSIIKTCAKKCAFLRRTA